MAAHAVADGEDGGQAVVLDLAGDLARALGSNYPEFPDSCLPAQFALLEDVHQVLVDRPHVLLEQLRHERLRQPDRLVLEPALDARPAVLGLVEDDAGLRRRFVGHRYFLELAGEGLVQQRLLQRVQRGELPLVDGFEALGFFA